MSLSDDTVNFSLVGPPRTSGDEPRDDGATQVMLTSAPHERG